MKLRLPLFLLLLTGYTSTHAQQPGLPANNIDSLKKITAIQKEANRQCIAASSIQQFVIKAVNDTYGYSIYVDGQLYIWQTTIPALPGSQGFKSAEAAGKAAKLVIEKMKQGELPPTLTLKELKQEKIIQ